VKVANARVVRTSVRTSTIAQAQRAGPERAGCGHLRIEGPGGTASRRCPRRRHQMGDLSLAKGTSVAALARETRIRVRAGR
jgi:hypothetical protein